MTCFAFCLVGTCVTRMGQIGRVFEIWFLYPVSTCFEDVSDRTC